MHSNSISQPSYDSLPKRRIRLRLVVSWRQISRFVFYLMFFICFWFSGILSMASIMFLPFDYRMGLTSLLIVPLLGRYGIKLNAVTLTFASLVFVILISGFINHTSLSNIALFIRIPFFAFVIYRLTEICLDPSFLLRILRLCVPLAIVQLPILLVQRVLYVRLPDAIGSQVSATDFDFGTFNFKGDSKMAFFLLMLVIFLLFNKYSYLVTRRRGLLAIWATVTVLIANSQVAKLAAVMIWGVYFLTKLNRKFAWRLMGSVAIFMVLFFASGYGTHIATGLALTVANTLRDMGGSPESMQKYLNGGYSRGGAIYYYVHRDLQWFGDGPSRYTNPISREIVRGDVGHIFTFYSEIGLIGLTTSLLIFALIAIHRRNLRVNLGLQPLLMFAVVIILMFTLQVMNDISVVLAYCIFARSYLLAAYENEQKQPTGQISRVLPG